jgi:dTDP-glucose 4,6-dehydratase
MTDHHHRDHHRDRPVFLVTGGAGFIGSHFARRLSAEGARVIVLDALTYAGHRLNLEGVENVTLIEGNILDQPLCRALLARHQPQGIFHFAAESHVDQSIEKPGAFVETNITGTYHLLEAALHHWKELDAAGAERFRYVQISTDEVFGALPPTGHFSETSPYAPNSPYSASKAAADHLALAWAHTYGLPVIVTHCSNNYGPRQMPEKFIPVLITRALAGEPLPLYGDGMQVRDWIHAEDHCHGVWLAYQRGKVAERYCFGGQAEYANLAVAHLVCDYLNARIPRRDGISYSAQIALVADRPGHDRRYAIDDAKAARELGFTRIWEFEQGLRATIDWYLENEAWREAVRIR